MSSFCENGKPGWIFHKPASGQIFSVMKSAILEEVIACLPADRTLFHYFKGQYAFFLLAHAARLYPSVSAIKQSPFQSLLRQPDVKAVLAGQGDGVLRSSLLETVWKEGSLPFVLTVDRWGNHDQWQYQTTRKGCNLVLQLNFSEQHNRAYRRLVKPTDDYIFNFYGHPVMDREKRSLYRETLAWARIDLDLDSGEALIEEIQSDWVRRVGACLQNLRRRSSSWHLRWCECDPEDFVAYAEKVLAPYDELWAEAMLAATLHFIRNELGIAEIFYHTHEAGQRLKRVGGGAPPRSLYSDLPRKFCFQITKTDPAFIGRDRTFLRKKRSIKQVEWYRLVL